MLPWWSERGSHEQAKILKIFGAIGTAKLGNVEVSDVKEPKESLGSIVGYIGPIRRVANGLVLLMLTIGLPGERLRGKRKCGGVAKVNKD